MRVRPEESCSRETLLVTPFEKRGPCFGVEPDQRLGRQVGAGLFERRRGVDDDDLAAERADRQSVDLLVGYALLEFWHCAPKLPIYPQFSAFLFDYFPFGGHGFHFAEQRVYFVADASGERFQVERAGREPFGDLPADFVATCRTVLRFRVFAPFAANVAASAGRSVCSPK